jgi:poly(A) polymerase
MRDKAYSIVKKLQDAGHQAVFAGGCVRDLIMRIEPNDYDIATSALPDQVEALFEKTIAVGKAFGVIVVVIDDVEFEVATFRNDGEYSDGRHPDSVTFTSMEEDAKRRDLTINGLFYDPIKKEFYDFVGGRQDIANQIVRLIGSPQKRIDEDNLRMMRVIRFAVRFGFTIEDETFKAVQQNANRITNVSVERIFDEFTKILKLGKYKESLNLLFETNLIDYIFPEFKKMKGCEQPADYHPEGDCLEHTIIALEHLSEDASIELRFGTLFHDIGKPRTQTFEDRIRFSNHDNVGAGVTSDILTRYKCSNEFIETVVAFVANHMKFMFVKEMRTSRLKRFMRLPRFDEHMELHRVDCLSSHGSIENYTFVKEQLTKLEPEQLRPIRIITGRDLIELGYKPGPIFKQILMTIEDAQLEGSVTTREEALKLVSEYEKEEKLVEPSVTYEVKSYS